MKTNHLSAPSLAQAAECLKVIAHPARLHMIQLLLEDDYTVGELAAACDIPSNSASEHLRLLQRCGLLQSARDGRQVYYQVADPCLSKIMDCIVNRFTA
jgi:DNA-binding transcriptional ArsR family regulator